MLTREALLANARPRIVEVPVPEWGGSVGLRELALGDLDALGGKDTADSATSARLIALSLVGADGGPLLSVEDIPALAAQRGRAAMTALMAEIDKLNALSAKAQEQVAAD